MSKHIIETQLLQSLISALISVSPIHQLIDKVGKNITKFVEPSVDICNKSEESKDELPPAA